MKCEGFGRLLTDLALGGSASPEMESHLSDCARCRVALEDQRRLISRIDEEIAASLDVAPSLEFLPKASLRIARQCAPTRSAFRGWLLPVTAVAAGTILVGLCLWWRRSTVLPSHPIAVKAPSAPPITFQPSPPSVPVPRAVVTTRIKRASRVTPLVEPEVLVPPGAEEAVRCLAEGLRYHSVDPARFLTAGFVVVGPEEARVNAPLEAVRQFPTDLNGTRLWPEEARPLNLEQVGRSAS
ncbi:MAG: hypothetical protein HYX75_18885 [Acidobacteria bacterium]|nr:hypothetical protein [Acidobacteriota bacterium]